eukprot:scaffold38873_cov18-Prasinocladus_malaysianus.AAC.2
MLERLRPTMPRIELLYSKAYIYDETSKGHSTGTAAWKYYTARQQYDIWTAPVPLHHYTMLIILSGKYPIPTRVIQAALLRDSSIALTCDSRKLSHNVTLGRSHRPIMGKHEEEGPIRNSNVTHATTVQKDIFCAAR